MNISRRQALMTTLFGAGSVGLRALATGLPAAFFLNPREALAGPVCPAGKAQYVIFNTSAAGDPINASAPGTYEDSKIIHSPDPALAGTSITMQGKSFMAGKPWSTLPQAVLDRTTFWHLMTNTPIHPKEPQVLQMMGAVPDHEMLPSLLAKAVAPCLKTIRAQPISLAGPSLAYEGLTMPVIPPLALRDTLTNPAGPLTNLQGLRDQTMSQIYALYKGGASPSQQAYIDAMVTSQQQVRNLEQSLLSKLSTIKDNSVASQMLAAVTLIQMNVAPVISVSIPFGGDNHSDGNLVKETAETISGVAAIASLMAQLQAAGLSDRVTFMSLNVFGRTLLTNGSPSISAANGRNHNQAHQVSITIGKPFKAGVVGGCAPVGIDYGATGIDSATGASSATGDIPAGSTLASFGQSVLSAVGGDPSSIKLGKVIAGALA